MNNLQFNIPSTVLIGANASAEVSAQVKRLGAERVLIVTDAGMREHGYVDRILDHLTRARITSAVFAEVQPDPTDRNVFDGVAQLQESRATVVVAALGGGSAIDCAKAICILATNPMGLASISDSDQRATESLVTGLSALNRDLAIPGLRDCRGTTPERFESSLTKMASDALASGSPQNNPRIPSTDEIMALYRESW